MPIELRGDAGDDEVLRRAVEFFRVYQGAIRGRCHNFADMVPLGGRTMDRNPGYSAADNGAFEHVLVDEYQDINPGQVETRRPGSWRRASALGSRRR